MQLLRGPSFPVFAFIMGAIALIAGVYITFFSMAGFVKTQGVITSIVEVDNGTEDTEHIVTVDYVAEGSRYSSELGYYSPFYKEGKTVTVYYDPKNPGLVRAGKGFGVYLMVLGTAFFVVPLAVLLRAAASQRE